MSIRIISITADGVFIDMVTTATRLLNYCAHKERLLREPVVNEKESVSSRFLVRSLRYCTSVCEEDPVVQHLCVRYGCIYRIRETKCTPRIDTDERIFGSAHKISPIVGVTQNGTQLHAHHYLIFHEELLKMCLRVTRMPCTITRETSRT